MVSTDIGNINSVANSYLRFEKPRSFFAPMSFGNCGYALPTIIGAKAAAPDRPAIAYAGDGAWGMSMVRDHDRRAPRHPGHRGRLPQPAVGRGEEEPGRLLQPPLRRRRARERELRRHRRRRWAPRASSSTSSRTSGPRSRRRSTLQMNEGKTTRHRDHVHPRAGRPVPPRRAVQAGAPARQVQGLRLGLCRQRGQGTRDDHQPDDREAERAGRQTTGDPQARARPEKCRGEVDRKGGPQDRVRDLAAYPENDQ